MTIEPLPPYAGSPPRRWGTPPVGNPHYHQALYEAQSREAQRAGAQPAPAAPREEPRM